MVTYNFKQIVTVPSAKGMFNSLSPLIHPPNAYTHHATTSLDSYITHVYFISPTTIYFIFFFLLSYFSTIHHPTPNYLFISPFVSFYILNPIPHIHNHYQLQSSSTLSSQKHNVKLPQFVTKIGLFNVYVNSMHVKLNLLHLLLKKN